MIRHSLRMPLFEDFVKRYGEYNGFVFFAECLLSPSDVYNSIMLINRLYLVNVIIVLLFMRAVFGLIHV